MSTPAISALILGVMIAVIAVVSLIVTVRGRFGTKGEESDLSIDPSSPRTSPPESASPEPPVTHETSRDRVPRTTAAGRSVWP